MNNYKDLIERLVVKSDTDSRDMLLAIEQLVADRDQNAINYGLEKADHERTKAELTAFKQKIDSAEPVAWGLQMPNEKYPRQIWIVKDSAFNSAMQRWPEAYKGAYQVQLYLHPSDDEKLRADAARYRWLKSVNRRKCLDLKGPEAGCWIDCEDDAGTLILLTEEDADTAVDAARAAEGEK